MHRMAPLSAGVRFHSNARYGFPYSAECHVGVAMLTVKASYKVNPATWGPPAKGDQLYFFFPKSINTTIQDVKMQNNESPDVRTWLPCSSRLLRPGSKVT